MVLPLKSLENISNILYKVAFRASQKVHCENFELNFENLLKLYGFTVQ